MLAGRALNNDLRTCSREDAGLVLEAQEARTTNDATWLKPGQVEELDWVEAYQIDVSLAAVFSDAERPA